MYLFYVDKYRAWGGDETEAKAEEREGNENDFYVEVAKKISLLLI